MRIALPPRNKATELIYANSKPDHTGFIRTMGEDEIILKETDAEVSEEEEDVAPDADPTNIHIYEEPETGGNLCAKLMFFTLFSSLIVLIALVAINYQGDFQSMSRKCYENYCRV